MATTMTLAGLFELAGKVALAERRRDFEQKKVREVMEEIQKLEAELRARQASMEAREREVEALSLEMDAHNGAVDWAGGLPDALWEMIAGRLEEKEAVFPFALACRRFREMQKRVTSAKSGKRRLRSKFVRRGEAPKVSVDWCEWVLTRRRKRSVWSLTH